MKGSKTLAIMISLCFSTLIARGAVAEQQGSNVLPTMEKANAAAQKPSLGVMVGVADQTNGGQTAANWGIDYTYQPYIPISLGAELTTYGFSGQGATPATTRVRALATMAYNFGGSTPVIRNSYIGAGLGPVFDNIRSSTDLELGFAPMVGFDIPLASEAEPHMSLGANASYLFVGGAKSDVFALNGAAKYWF